MSSISRRSMITTAAAPPALTVPAVAADDVGDDAELLRLAAEVKAAWEQLGDACDALGVAEAKVAKWRKSNPLPDDDAGFTMWEAGASRNAVGARSRHGGLPLSGRCASASLGASLCQSRLRSLSLTTR